MYPQGKAGMITALDLSKKVKAATAMQLNNPLLFQWDRATGSNDQEVVYLDGLSRVGRSESDGSVTTIKVAEAIAACIGAKREDAVVASLGKDQYDLALSLWADIYFGDKHIAEEYARLLNWIKMAAAVKMGGYVVYSVKDMQSIKQQHALLAQVWPLLGLSLHQTINTPHLNSMIRETYYIYRRTQSSELLDLLSQEIEHFQALGRVNAANLGGGPSGAGQP